MIAKTSLPKEGNRMDIHKKARLTPYDRAGLSGALGLGACPDPVIAEPHR